MVWIPDWEGGIGEVLRCWQDLSLKDAHEIQNERPKQLSVGIPNGSDFTKAGLESWVAVSLFVAMRSVASQGSHLAKPHGEPLAAPLQTAMAKELLWLWKNDPQHVEWSHGPVKFQGCWFLFSLESSRSLDSAWLSQEVAYLLDATSQLHYDFRVRTWRDLWMRRECSSIQKFLSLPWGKLVFTELKADDDIDIQYIHDLDALVECENRSLT